MGSAAAHPLLPATFGLLVGASLGHELAFPPSGAAVALAGLALSLRGRLGCVTLGLATGLTLAAVQLGAPALDPLPDRPVTLAAQRLGPWFEDEQGWRTTVRSAWLRQADKSILWRQEVQIRLAAGRPPGDESGLRIRGYLRRPPPLANGWYDGEPPWILWIKSPRLLDRDPVLARSWLRPARRLGARCRRRIEEHLQTAGTGASGWSEVLISVFLLGDNRALPAAAARGLRSAGLAHLAALSGLHVGLVAAMVLICVNVLPRRLQHAAVLCSVVAYILIAGPRPSLLRAALMLTGVLTAWALRRPPQSLVILAWVAGAMVIVDPGATHDLGFQLTVAATFGILTLAPRFDQRWTLQPRTLRQALAVSVGASLGALPWTLSRFHLATPLAPLWNLLGIPWAGTVLATSLVWLVTSWISPPLARWGAPLLDWLARPLEVVAAAPPQVLRPLPANVEWLPGAALAVTIALFLLAAGWRRLICALLLLCCLLVVRPEAAPVLPEMTMIDVGQGEAILLRDGRHAVLVDGGGWRGSDIAQRVLVPMLASSGLRRLEAAILTHPDADHCQGLLQLASYVPIGRIYTHAGWRGDACFLDLIARAHVDGVPIWRGESLSVGRWQLTVLHPAAGHRRGRNDRSLVLEARTASNRILLTGDIEAAAEAEIIEEIGRARLRHVDVLKVAHHGSQTSTSRQWLALTAPAVGLISCGRWNRYGHPAATTLERLSAGRTRILRTDLHGAIRLTFPLRGRVRVSFAGLGRRADLAGAG